MNTGELYWLDTRGQLHIWTHGALWQHAQDLGKPKLDRSPAYGEVLAEDVWAIESCLEKESQFSLGEW